MALDSTTTVECAARLELTALPGVPRIEAGDDLPDAVCRALVRAEIEARDCDVLVVTSKVVSRAEGRFVDLSRVRPSPRARALSAEVDKDPALVELILGESSGISRMRRGVLIVRHRLGFVSANAGIDESNAQPANAPEGSGPWVLLLPHAPDATASALRSALAERLGVELGVVISDSHGRPFRFGSVGVAIGSAGLPALCDLRGQCDLDSRELRVSTTGLADQIAAAADLVAGQADEGRPVVHVRGLSFAPDRSGASALLRPAEQDLYA